jgi:hypothetical protein
VKHVAAVLVGLPLSTSLFLVELLPALSVQIGTCRPAHLRRIIVQVHRMRDFCLRRSQPMQSVSPLIETIISSPSL